MAKTYTYRKGKKVDLKKEPDQFVVRATSETLKKKGSHGSTQQDSPHTAMLSVKSADLDSTMSEIRKEAGKAL